MHADAARLALAAESGCLTGGRCRKLARRVAGRA